MLVDVGLCGCKHVCASNCVRTYLCPYLCVCVSVYVCVCVCHVPVVVAAAAALQCHQ